MKTSTPPKDLLWPYESLEEMQAAFPPPEEGQCELAILRAANDRLMNQLEQATAMIRGLSATVDVLSAPSKLPKVWRCTLREVEFGTGGISTTTMYAKTEQDMMIYRDQGYTCIPLKE